MERPRPGPAAGGPDYDAAMSGGNQAYELGLRSVGRDVVIWPRAHIVGAEHIAFGDSVIVDDFVFMMAGARHDFGSFVHLATGVSIVGGGELSAGDFVGISGGTRVYTGNDDYLGGSLTGPTIPPAFRTVERSSVRFGRHAIIGANSVVLPGVEIGEGAAVGALSLVNRDLEPWTVYVGQPARAVRERPRARIDELEAELRAALYDAEGRYIPAAARPTG